MIKRTVWLWMVVVFFAAVLITIGCFSKAHVQNRSKPVVAEVDNRGIEIENLLDKGELYGFSSLSVMTNTGVFISRVTTPTGDVTEGDPYLNPGQPTISRQSACLTDPHPDDVPADNWYSEFNEDDAVPGIRTFYLTGAAGVNYSVHFTIMDCSNNMTTELRTGSLDASGTATVTLDHQPGNLEKGPRRLK